jgi:hypothetical protein
MVIASLKEAKGWVFLTKGYKLSPQKLAYLVI